MYIYRNYISNNSYIRWVVDQWPAGIQKGIHWCPHLRHLQGHLQRKRRFLDALPFQITFVIVLLQGISGTRVVHRCVHLSGGVHLASVARPPRHSLVGERGGRGGRGGPPEPPRHPTHPSSGRTPGLSTAAPNFQKSHTDLSKKTSSIKNHNNIFEQVFLKTSNKLQKE